MTQKTTAIWTEELGERLKQARLNLDLTQTEVAHRAHITRKTVIQAEKGKVQLEQFIAILQALNLSDQLNLLLPPQPISPLQLAKLQGKKRQRASKQQPSQTQDNEPTW